MTSAKHSSASNEHMSPEAVAKASVKTLGRIDLDPASSPLANKVIGAEQFFTFMDNGLKREWHGNVFLNPPGGTVKNPGSITRSRQALWWWKLQEEYKANRTAGGIFLGFSIEVLQTTQMMEDILLPLDFPFCIPRKRLAYDLGVGHKRITGDSPPHGNVIVYLPTREDPSARRFEAEFSHIGKVRT